MGKMTQSDLRSLHLLLRKFKLEDVTAADFDQLRELVKIDKPYTAEFADPDMLFDTAMVLLGTYVTDGTYPPKQNTVPFAQSKGGSSAFRYRESGSPVLRSSHQGSSILSGRVNYPQPTSIRQPPTRRNCVTVTRIGPRVTQRRGQIQKKEE